MRRFINQVSVDRLVTLMGFAGLALFLALYNSAFPSAALQMTRSRAEITSLANQYMLSHGYSLQDYQFVLTFGADSSASIFLQRTLGIPATNRLIQKENLPLWYWRARWFKVKQQEEFYLYLMPDGKISGFSHILPEEAPGAHLDQEAARALAAQLLTAQGWDLSNWEQADASSSDLPARRDHSFAWKRSDFQVGDSQLRLNVTIKGDQVGYYDYWLKVPQEFTRTFSEQRNLPGFINNVAYFVGVGGFGALAILILGYGLFHGVNPLRRVLPLVLLVLLVSLLANINSLFVYKAWYSTTEDWILFWIEALTNTLLYPIVAAAFVGLVLAGGQYIIRQVWPLQDKVLPRGPNRWGNLARSGWRGVMLGGVLLGYAVLFYLVATLIFGGWTPLDMSSTAGLASPMPFMDAIQSGLLAASQEETIFRLVGVSLVYWLTRKKWLALLIPGAIWAFAHLSYIRDPFYMRGIELLITAVFIEGLFFLYFDLTTTIVAHMTYNAMLGALPLLRSSDPYLIFSGVVVIVAILSPVIVGLLLSRLRRGRLPNGDPRMVTAGPDDLPRLLQLPVDGPDWQALLRNPCAVVVVLEASGQIIGAAAGEVTTVGSEPGRGSLLAAWVDPAWRGQFWGSRLIDETWLHLQLLGALSFNARVPSHLKPAYAFLSTLNWQVTEQTLTRQPGTLVGTWLMTEWNKAKRDILRLCLRIRGL